jgi:NADPH-ferrihemoprotein reductase
VQSHRIFIKDSTFRQLEDAVASPILMVGPGTGVVPFIGMMQDRLLALGEGKERGEWSLFFGCRRKDVDFIYREEIEEFRDQKVVQHLFLAFSREQQQKIYVQTLMREEAQRVKQVLVEQKGLVYICGSTKMG